VIEPTPQPRRRGGGSVDPPGRARRRGVAEDPAGRARSGGAPGRRDSGEPVDRGRRPAPDGARPRTGNVAGPRRKTPRPKPPRAKKKTARSDKPDGPQVTLGILWAAVTLAATVEGPVWLAIWLAPVAALAAASTLRSWPRPAGRGSTTWAGLGHVPVVVGAASAAVVLASAVDVWAALSVAALLIVAIVAAEVQGRTASPGPFRRALLVLLPAAAASGLVLARAQGLTEGITLVAVISVYDSAAFLMGTGARFAVEGPIAVLLSIGALTLFLAAVPPFDGNTPWILGGIAAVLAPLGPILARRLTGDDSVRVPALRRLDSLILLGPAWAAATAVLLHV
jgi:hypothetical protein